MTTADYQPVSPVLTVTRGPEGVRLYADLHRTTMTPAEALALAAALTRAAKGL